jgi:hypothetical protein
MNNEVSIPWDAIVDNDRALRSRADKARAGVARHAQLDADACAFVLSPEQLEGHDMKPATLGFSASSTAMRWTAEGLFTPWPPGKPTPPASPGLARPRYRDPFEESEPSADRGDPFQCVPQLNQTATACRRVLGALQCAGAQARSRLAAHLRDLAQSLALDLGRCRLFGVSPETDFTLDARAFEMASTGLIEKLSRLLRRMGRVIEKTSATESARETALQLLEIRTDAHATCLALDEAYAAALYEGKVEAPAMGRRMHQVRRLIDILDGNLRKNIPLLRLAASTQLLKNWRRLLAPEYRATAPWWMAGETE